VTAFISERQPRILLERVNFVRALIDEIECDCGDWQCDADLTRALTQTKTNLDNATLVLALLQPMRKH
jgi:hypothetical protein